MNKYIVLGLLALSIPFNTHAALSEVQATSLIGVVQSSPGIPASAFTDLITAFSLITNKQAESLIAVVQAAPGVPADSFVNLLLSFTVDPIVESTKIDELTQKVAEIDTKLGQVVTNTTPTTEPAPTPEVVIPQTVSYTSQVVAGDTCPKFTFTSNKSFTPVKLTFNNASQLTAEYQYQCSGGKSCSATKDGMPNNDGTFTVSNLGVTNLSSFWIRACAFTTEKPTLFKIGTEFSGADGQDIEIQ